MRGDWKLALLVTFPCWYIGAICLWLATTGTTIIHPGPGSTANPAVVFSIMGLCFIGLGVFCWRGLAPSDTGASDDSDDATAAPTAEVAAQSPTAKASLSGGQPVKSWTGRSSIWLVVVEVVLTLLVAWVLVMISEQFLGAGVTKLAIVGVVLVWIFGVWFVLLILWALTFVAPVTFRMDGQGVQIRRFRQPTRRLAYKDIADVTWVGPAPGRGGGTFPGLLIHPKNTKAPDGHTLSEAEIETQWFLGLMQFSNKQWRQIKAALSQAVKAADGTVWM